MTQMMPPPLPGYPVPAAPPPQAPPPAATAPAFVPPAYAQPAPQGYPGPAVAAPAPFPGQPQPGQPFPVYAQPQPAPGAHPAPTYAQPQAAAPGGGFDIGAAIAGATGGDRDPVPGDGRYTLEVEQSIVTKHPVDGRYTFKLIFKIKASTNPQFPEGTACAYIEGLTWDSGKGRTQEAILNLCGFTSLGAYKQAVAAQGRDPEAELKLLGNAAANPEVQQPNNHYPPNPLKGRLVHAVVQRKTKIARPPSPKAGQTVDYTAWTWTPA